MMKTEKFCDWTLHRIHFKNTKSRYKSISVHLSMKQIYKFCFYSSKAIQNFTQFLQLLTMFNNFPQWEKKNKKTFSNLFHHQQSFVPPSKFIVFFLSNFAYGGRKCNQILFNGCVISELFNSLARFFFADVQHLKRIFSGCAGFFAALQRFSR